jgi:UPF0755 protein
LHSPEEAAFCIFPHPMKRFLIVFLVSVLLVGGILAWQVHRMIYADNVALEETYELKIPSVADYDDVVGILSRDEVLKDCFGFRMVAERMNYPSHVHPGLYQIEPEMSNREILLMLRQGQPLDFPITIAEVKIQSIEDLAGHVSQDLEFDSASLYRLLTNDAYLDSLGRTEDNVLCLIIPNTYNFYYNTTARGFMNRMIKEHQLFWDSSRLEEAAARNLNPTTVYILASIIEKEYKNADELPRMAGVYLNRLDEPPYLLEADPTVKFAVGDPTIRRVLNVHKEVESPYNTYKNPGLPPGPICLPSIRSIEAVLNAEDHDYFFFCAKPDESGYHAFAETYSEHLKNAAAYHAYLNQLEIYN